MLAIDALGVVLQSAVSQEVFPQVLCVELSSSVTARCWIFHLFGCWNLVEGHPATSLGRLTVNATLSIVLVIVRVFRPARRLALAILCGRSSVPTLARGLQRIIAHVDEGVLDVEQSSRGGWLLRGVCRSLERASQQHGLRDVVRVCSGCVLNEWPVQFFRVAIFSPCTPPCKLLLTERGACMQVGASAAAQMPRRRGACGFDNVGLGTGKLDEGVLHDHRRLAAAYGPVC
mmetsp:Transcript_114386/g.296230  ORF Transcript_114386/g.296230 Transcript_114386/m.296230 type:complete len:231 (+) Transcript_114386:618-1310(+)